MLKKIIIENKQTLIIVAIILVVFGIIKYSRHKELNDSSISVEGKIVECKSVNLSGACVATIQYITQEGEIKMTTNTLYKKENCFVGNTVKLQYSTKSNLTNVVE